jgi:flavin reductase (DIM6/NTAB) family NADH-FMN oxidoreductase RutF
VTIHPEHPFQAALSDRDPVRRLRGRLGGTVTLWTTGGGEQPRAGLTVSSRMVATGDPGHALALLDPDSSFAETLSRTRTCVMSLLSWEHRAISDAFAGVSPAPGGIFRLGEWTESEWGPVLVGVSGWAGLRLVEGDLPVVGWSILAHGVIEHIEIGTETEPLMHRRGQYHRHATP